MIKSRLVKFLIATGIGVAASLTAFAMGGAFIFLAIESVKVCGPLIGTALAAALLIGLVVGVAAAVEEGF